VIGNKFSEIIKEKTNEHNYKKLILRPWGSKNTLRDLLKVEYE